MLGTMDEFNPDRNIKVINGQFALSAEWCRQFFPGVFEDGKFYAVEVIDVAPGTMGYEDATRRGRSPWLLIDENREPIVVE